MNGQGATGARCGEMPARSRRRRLPTRRPRPSSPRGEAASTWPCRHNATCSARPMEALEDGDLVGCLVVLGPAVGDDAAQGADPGRCATGPDRRNFCALCFHHNAACANARRAGAPLAGKTSPTKRRAVCFRMATCRADGPRNCASRRRGSSPSTPASRFPTNPTSRATAPWPKWSPRPNQVAPTCDVDAAAATVTRPQRRSSTHGRQAPEPTSRGHGHA